MNIFTALTVVAIVAIVAGTIKSLANNRYKKTASTIDTQDFELQIEQLKQRVSTLEAIVTDKNYDLDKQIDRL